MKEDKQNKKVKEHQRNLYLETLAMRLKQERNAKGITQKELAEKLQPFVSSITREKIIHTEANTQGRSLNVTEIAEIANYFNVSYDYLIGLTNNRNVGTSNGLTEETNKIIAEWSQNSLEIFDSLAQAYSKKNGVLDTLKTYFSISYLIDKTLTTTIESIETKINELKDILNDENREILALHYFLGRNFLRDKFIKDYPFEENYIFNNYNMEQRAFVETLAKQNIETITSAFNGCVDILNFKNDKSIKPPFESIKEVKEVLETFRKYLLGSIIEAETKAIKDIAEDNLLNDMYYNKIHDYLPKTTETTEQSKVGMEQQKDTTVKKSK